MPQWSGCKTITLLILWLEVTLVTTIVMFTFCIKYNFQSVGSRRPIIFAGQSILTCMMMPIARQLNTFWNLCLKLRIQTIPPLGSRIWKVSRFYQCKRGELITELENRELEMREAFKKASNPASELVVHHCHRLEDMWPEIVVRLLLLDHLIYTDGSQSYTY